MTFNYKSDDRYLVLALNIIETEFISRCQEGLVSSHFNLQVFDCVWPRVYRETEPTVRVQCPISTDNISPVMGIGSGEVGALNDPAEPRHLGVADGGVVKLEAPARVAAIRSEPT